MDLGQPNAAQPLGEPRGPVMMVPVRVFFRPGHRWTLDFAAACSVGVAAPNRLTRVRIENTRVVSGHGAFLNLVDVLGELEEYARLLTLLLRDGLAARDIANRLTPWIGESVVSIKGAQGFCRNAGAALLLAAVHVEDQIAHSALPEMAARGLLSDMG